MNRLPQKVTEALKEYQSLLEEKLPNHVHGIYLYGSIALNAFEPKSDIDMLTILSKPLTEKEIEVLHTIHKDMEDKFPKPRLECAYIQKDTLGQHAEKVSPYPYYDGYQFHREGHWNHNPVTWWTFSKYGVRITGPSIDSYSLEVNHNELTSFVIENMNSYWKMRLQALKQIEAESVTTEALNEEIEWSILGVLRQFYTLKELDITSKLKAGNYGLDQLPHKSHKIIREAIAIRNNLSTDAYLNHSQRKEDTINFLEELIDYCNKIPIQKYPVS